MLTQSTQISRTPSNFFNAQHNRQHYRISITDYVVLDDRTRYTFYFLSLCFLHQAENLKKRNEPGHNSFFLLFSFSFSHKEKKKEEKKKDTHSSSFVSIFSYSISLLVVNTDRRMSTR